MVKAIVIPVTGQAEVRNVDGTLESIQSLVGGFIEHVSVLSDGTHMYLNEDGKEMGLPMNVLASNLMWNEADYRIAPFPNDFIVGDVVLLGKAPDGEEGNVSEDAIALCRQAGMQLSNG